MTCSYLICHLLFSCHYELSGFHINQFSMFTKQMALFKKKEKKMTLNDKKKLQRLHTVFSEPKCNKKLPFKKVNLKPK